MMNKADEMKKKFLDAVASYNKKVATGASSREVTKAKAEVKEAMEAYNDTIEDITMGRLRVTKTPMLNAIKVYGPVRWVIKEDKDTGVLRTEVDKPETSKKPKAFSLEALCDTFGTSKKWMASVETFRQRLGVINGHLVSSTVVDVASAELNGAYKPNGDEPDKYSNTSLQKLLQAALDEVIFEDNGKGKNVHQVRVCDIQFLNRASDRYAGNLTIASIGEKKFRDVFFDMVVRIVVNGAYRYDMKTINGKKVPQSARHIEHTALEDVLK